MRDLDENLAGVTVVLAALPEEPLAHARRSTWFSEWAGRGHVFDDVDGAVAALLDAPR